MFLLRSFTFVGSFAAGLLAAVPAFSLGLILYPEVHIPFFLVVVAWYTSIGALWAERLAPSSSRASLWRVVGFSEMLAALLCVFYFVFQSSLQRLLMPPIILLLACTVILALGSSLAAWSHRQDGRDLRPVIRATFYGIAGSTAFTVLVVALAAYLGLAGA